MGVDSDISSTALVIAILALFITFSQALQQYIATATDSRRCRSDVIGDWVDRKYSRPELKELRYEVKHSYPHISLTTVEHTLNSGMYHLIGSDKLPGGAAKVPYGHRKRAFWTRLSVYLFGVTQKPELARPRPNLHVSRYPFLASLHSYQTKVKDHFPQQSTGNEQPGPKEKQDGDLEAGAGSTGSPAKSSNGPMDMVSWLGALGESFHSKPESGARNLLLPAAKIMEMSWDFLP